MQSDMPCLQDTLKTGLGVLQVHWTCRHSIQRISNYGYISCRFWDI